LEATPGGSGRQALFSLEIRTMAESQSIELAATARTRGGKGSARQARRDGRVPAVIYGDRQAPEMITLEYNTLFKQYMKGHFTSTVLTIDIDGKKVQVIPRDVQVDPVRDLPIHADFQRVGPNSRIRVNVPVRFVNEGLSPGLKRGGVLNIVRHDVEVTCPANAIPTAFEVDLTGLEIGRSIHISSVKLPEGVRPTITNRDFTVATIAGAVRQDDEAATTAAGGEAAAGAAAPAAGGEKAAAAPAAAGAGGDKKK
jgi:large subunit ribosomal protein L25